MNQGNSGQFVRDDGVWQDGGLLMHLPAENRPSDARRGDTVRIVVQLPVQLSNDGGTLTLLDPAGLKVDGVAYTRDQAAAEGRTVVF